MSPGRSDSSAYRGTSYQKGNIAKFKRNIALCDMVGIGFLDQLTWSQH